MLDFRGSPSGYSLKGKYTMGKITYATMSADDPALHQAYEEGLAAAGAQVGQTHPLLINGEKRYTAETYTERSPIDSELVVGVYSQASDGDVDDAVAAARAFQPEWEATPWQDRVAIIRRAADIMEEETPTLAGFLSLEIGKNRLEALGDVSEAVAFASYYCDRLDEAGGMETAMGAYGVGDTNHSVLRPWGVWAIISPFNFPMALVASPTSAALLTGNTVVLKPSNTGALGSLLLADIYSRAGLPAGALHVVTGGDEAGDRLAHHDDVDGVTFTGSYDVGMHLYRTVAAGRPKPVVCEMGGKNPAVVTASADLELAAEGVMRAAFGLSGQKCSANSRVYVEKPAYQEFVNLLAGKTGELQVGDPRRRETFVGPVIDQEAVGRFRSAVEAVKEAGGEVISGGEVVTEGDLERGNFVQPTVVTAPEETWIWEKELFVPFVAVTPVDSLDEGIDKANDTIFGLTAGVFAGTDGEVDRFFERIQAGVVYANRRAGSTTGAWPDIQPFGGWKGSGTSGAGSGGPWYMRSYVREQARTVIRE